LFDDGEISKSIHIYSNQFAVKHYQHRTKTTVAFRRSLNWLREFLSGCSVGGYIGNDSAKWGNADDRAETTLHNHEQHSVQQTPPHVEGSEIQRRQNFGVFSVCVLQATVPH
jgi:hypothetical protein